ncbi:hypothetical protein NLI96_g4954 [Meripilus lineatus]|uniref:Uncharacterized protein n=1 Tax=Meripilus lineatus TaxID=2056292 RepID=A0AAD5V606_9APHY|nr:hypothetical protein NLI96_g4954 [Physisporinus lineatus]
MFSRISTLALLFLLPLMAVASPVELPRAVNEVREPAGGPLGGLLGGLPLIGGLLPALPVGGILRESESPANGLPAAPLPNLGAAKVDTAKEGLKL